MVNIIAELSVNHLGMRKIAAVMVERLADMGVDYIKLKKKDVESYYKPGKEYKGYDFIKYRKSLELDIDDFVYLDEVCNNVGIEWFSTIHGPKSFEFVSQFDVPFYKVASMDARDFEFIKWIVGENKDKLPLIISTGGQDLDYITHVAKYVRGKNIPLVMNYCVSIYPTQINQIDVNKMINFMLELGPVCKLGYSGHESRWAPTLMAITLGYEYIERHVTLSRDLNIHHIDASLTLEEFKQMVSDVRDMETLMTQNGNATIDKEYEFLEERVYQ